MERQRRTILFSVIVEEQRPQFLEIIGRYGGQLLKTIVEAHICAFESPSSACEAALEFQRTVELSSTSIEELTDWRAGLAEGEVVVTPDLLGEAVNLAARLQGIAQPGHIYISESVAAAIEGTKIPKKEIGVQKFSKSGPEVRIFALGRSEVKEAGIKREAFDFTKVEMEHIDELKQQLAAIPPLQETELIIPLQSDPLPGNKPPFKPVLVPRSPHTKPNSFSRAKRTLLGLAVTLLSLGLFVGAGIWFYFRISPPTDNHWKDEAVKQGLAKSEVLQAMNQKRPPKAPKVPTYGAIVIRAAPPNAEIYLQKKLVAHETPVRLKQIPSGMPLTLEIRAPGFQNWVQFLNLGPNEEKEIKAALVKKP